MAKLSRQQDERVGVAAQPELSPDLWANEYVFEIRFAPNSRILDHRGKWAQLISGHMALPEWQIIENRLDVFSTDQKTRVFVGYRNAGLMIIDSPSRNYFQTQSEKILRFFFRQIEFGSTLNIERVGVRGRFATRFDGTFEELGERVASRYIQIPGPVKTAVGEKATLTDIGISLNWKDDLGNFNTGCGPMRQTELKQAFKRGDENAPPEVALYFDIDYFKRPKSLMLGTEIISTISKFAAASSQRYQAVRDLIYGD